MRTGKLVNIIAVNRKLRLALDSENNEGRITNLIDSDGDDTDDLEGAVTGVVEWPDGTWSAVDFRDYEFKEPH